MKRKFTRLMAFILTCALAAGLLTACGNSRSSGTKTENGDEILFTYDGVDVTLKKAWIYAKMTAAEYDATYPYYFGDDYWFMSMGEDDDGNDITFEDYAKEMVISQIKQIIVLDNRADEADASLSDDEIEECAEYAKAFADDDSGNAILRECGATEEDMAEIYEENALASKVQEYMVSDIDTEVSDDEARETTIARIVFDLTDTDDDGNTVDMDEDQKAEVYAEAQEALARILDGEDIETVAEDLEYTNTSETFAAGESEEGEDFEALLPDMSDGDVMEEVMECDNGYVIAQLTAYTDEDATADNKESILEDREEDRFYEVYDEWTEELEEDWSYEDDVNQELWAEVILHSEESTATDNMEETTAAEDEE